jgi:hypothetical protein
MNKKASTILMMIFEVLVVLIVVTGGFRVAGNIAEEESVKRILFAEEVRLMVNTLVGLPGDAVVDFPYDITDYVFVFQSTPTPAIVVFNKDKDDDARITKRFYLPQGYKIIGSVKDSAKLCLNKEGKTIKLDKC